MKSQHLLPPGHTRKPEGTAAPTSPMAAPEPRCREKLGLRRPTSTLALL